MKTQLLHTNSEGMYVDGSDSYPGSVVIAFHRATILI